MYTALIVIGSILFGLFLGVAFFYGRIMWDYFKNGGMG